MFDNTHTATSTSPSRIAGLVIKVAKKLVCRCPVTMNKVAINKAAAADADADNATVADLQLRLAHAAAKTEAAQITIANLKRQLAMATADMEAAAMAADTHNRATMDILGTEHSRLREWALGAEARGFEMAMRHYSEQQTADAARIDWLAGELEASKEAAKDTEAAIKKVADAKDVIIEQERKGRRLVTVELAYIKADVDAMGIDLYNQRSNQGV
ncbi:hypothetical protein IWW50_003284 [Coemansia erecta]|nr:hypothetical protein GGF43_002579 [Coemansia sp. RSA 2618]KAJ2824552.1 hypothetical protein IWW50_003284 [Coemansia erecta]